MYANRTILLVSLLLVSLSTYALPYGFVYLRDVDPTIVQDMRYCSANNFTGHPVRGYQKPMCILTQKAAFKLKKIQQQLHRYQLSLKVYDCYRPQIAVNDFIDWSRNDDKRMQSHFFPHLSKPDLFRQNYLAARSGHSRGSTVDVGLVRLDGKEVAMGTSFDFLDPLSHPLTGKVNLTAKQNRFLLRRLMLEAGFIPLQTEWWHFTLAHEPFPHYYFNFPVA